VASSLLNTGQQVGGSIGLAVLGTVAWSAVASSLGSAAGKPGHATTAMTSHALAYGFSRGFVVSAGIILLTLVVALVMLRVKRDDLAGINPMAAPAD
jgi:threonine/homoserine/homoserine lactone efflux protein